MWKRMTEWENGRVNDRQREWQDKWETGRMTEWHNDITERENDRVNEKQKESQSKRVIEWENGIFNDRENDRRSEWLNEWVNELVDQWRDEWRLEWMNDGVGWMMGGESRMNYRRNGYQWLPLGVSADIVSLLSGGSVRWLMMADFISSLTWAWALWNSPVEKWGMLSLWL